MDLDQQGHMLYLADRTVPGIDVVDISSPAAKYVTRVALSSPPRGVVVARNVNKVFTRLDNRHVGVIDIDPSSPRLNTIVADLDSGGTGTANWVDYDPVDKKMYSSNTSGQSLTVIDAVANQVIKAIALPGGSLGEPRYDASDGMVYLPGSTDNVLYRIDPKTDTVVAKISLADDCHPTGMAIDPSAGIALLNCRNPQNQHVAFMDLRTGTVAATFPNIGQGDMAIYDARDDRYFLAGSGFFRGAAIGIFGGTPVAFLTNVPTTSNSHNVAYDETNRRVYTQGPDGLLSFPLPALPECSVLPCSDNFSDPAKGLFLDAQRGAGAGAALNGPPTPFQWQYGYKDGALVARIAGDIPDGSGGVFTVVAPATGKIMTDFAVQVHCRVTDSPGQAGCLIRYDLGSDGYYQFAIFPGTQWLEVRTSGTSPDLADGQKAAINPGNTDNEMRMEVVGDSWRTYVNGQLLASVQSAGIAKRGGAIQLAAQMVGKLDGKTLAKAPDGEVEVSFSNFSVMGVTGGTPEPTGTPLPKTEPIQSNTLTPPPTLRPTPKSSPSWRETGTPRNGDVPGANWIEVDALGGRKMLASVFRPDGAGPFPVIVVLHGTQGFRGLYLDLAQRLSQGGFVTVAGCWFSGHYGLGFNPSPATFKDDIDCPNGPAFPTGVDSTAVSNALRLVDAARNLPGVRSDAVGVFGHSRGSILGVLAAAAGGIQAVVANAGYPPASGIGNLQAPVLILQGTSDNTVAGQAPGEFEDALRAMGKPVETYYVEGGSHQIAFETPWKEDVRQRTIAFFAKYLKGS